MASSEVVQPLASPSPCVESRTMSSLTSWLCGGSLLHRVHFNWTLLNLFKQTIDNGSHNERLCCECGCNQVALHVSWLSGASPIVWEHHSTGRPCFWVGSMGQYLFPLTPRSTLNSPVQRAWRCVCVWTCFDFYLNTRLRSAPAQKLKSKPK